MKKQNERNYKVFFTNGKRKRLIYGWVLNWRSQNEKDKFYFLFYYFFKKKKGILISPYMTGQTISMLNRVVKENEE